MSSKSSLRLDWCSHAAAKYAVEHWHYSGTLSSAKNAYVGVWETGRFIGAVVFGIGAGAVTNGTRYGLARTCEMAELTRVALTSHQSPVTRIITIAARMLKKQSPGLRLLISMADPREGHHGGIYQGAGWIYTGHTASDYEYFMDGAWRHHRTVTSKRTLVGLPRRKTPPKHRYLLPLDEEIRARILPLSQPYPKRPKDQEPGVQPGLGGETPTRPLQSDPGESE